MDSVDSCQVVSKQRGVACDQTVMPLRVKISHQRVHGWRFVQSKNEKHKGVENNEDEEAMPLQP